MRVYDKIKKLKIDDLAELLVIYDFNTTSQDYYLSLDGYRHYTKEEAIEFNKDWLENEE